MTEDNEVTIRKLTPKECLRLMGYNDIEIDRLMEARRPDGKPKYPKTALYTFAGNSVVVDMFVAVFREILADMDRPPSENPNTLDYWMGGSQ